MEKVIWRTGWFDHPLGHWMASPENSAISGALLLADLAPSSSCSQTSLGEQQFMLLNSHITWSLLPWSYWLWPHWVMTQVAGKRLTLRRIGHPIYYTPQQKSPFDIYMGQVSWHPLSIWRAINPHTSSPDFFLTNIQVMLFPNPWLSRQPISYS